MPGENEKVQAFAPQGIENAGVDISFTVPANGWSENSPYTYTWTNSNILSNSRVTVGFASGNSSTDVIYLDCEKVTGGIQLTSSVKPSAALYLVAHIINAKMDSYADVHGDMVATDVITGASNVDEALEDLDSRVDALNSKIIPKMPVPITTSTEVFRNDANGFDAHTLANDGWYRITIRAGSNGTVILGTHPTAASMAGVVAFASAPANSMTDFVTFLPSGLRFVCDCSNANDLISLKKFS